MIRPGLLAVLAVVLAPLSSPAQMGGMMGGMGGRGGGMMGAGMGGMMGGRPSLEQDRVVKIEMTGGQNLSGKIHLGPVIVDSDVGQYAINPDKVRTIRLSKPEQSAGDGTIPYTAVQGTVITTSGKEIRGSLHIPDWTLEIDDGSLRLVPEKLKTISFTAEPERQLPEKTSGKVPDTRYMRLENTLVMTSPRGDRVTFVDLKTKETRSVRLSESNDTALKVVPIWGPNAVALSLTGPKITRIAAANGLNGDWHTQDLREPVKGEAMPLIGPGVVAYGLGRYIYAYSVAAQRWGVAELPKGVLAVPIVGANSVRAEIPGHIYTFDSQTARWNHVDIGALLETASDKDGDTDKPRN